VLITTAAEMRRIDALAIERCGIPAATLMERAGVGAAEIVLRHFPHVRKTGVLVVAGKGNNGGDGFVLARALRRRRVRCEVVLAAPRNAIQGPARAKMLAWQRAGGRTQVVTEANLAPLQRAFARAGCLIDGLFGTGIRGTVTGLAAEIITLMNASGLPTVALDLPSGLDADTGEPAGVAIQAELTIAFAAPKLGTVVFPGVRFTGQLAIVDIGIPDEAVALVDPTVETVGGVEAGALLRPRDPESHKGTHGHVAIIAGGRGKTGAAVLAARAAARAGAGLVTVGCPAGVQPEIAARLVEPMTTALPEDVDGGVTFNDPVPYAHLLAGKQAVVAGPGLGVSPERRALVAWLVRESRVPLVLDADALNCLVEGTGTAQPSPAGPLVLTPHPGEMARLCGRSTAEVQRERLAVARALAVERGAVVVLKGARTITAEPGGRAWINLSGNPGLGSGGTGDVLAGIIGGLLAQGFPAAEAARLGVFLHGAAADAVARDRGSIGMLASDVIEALPATTAALMRAAEDTPSTP
jgi:NAD(P)H-hydrate epimerase